MEGSENFTLLTGKQSLKFGVLIRYYQWLGYDSQTYAGQFTFNSNETGDAYADFLLGYPSVCGAGLSREQLRRTSRSTSSFMVRMTFA